MSRALSILVLLQTAAFCTAQTSYPMLMSLQPTAAQIGTTSEHTIQSRYSLAGAGRILVSGTGVTAEVVPPASKSKPSTTTLKVKFTVAPDALPGVRDFRVATPRGVSTIGQLVIVADPIVREAAGNDTLSKAQAVKLPATICGTIEKVEDVDFYKFKATKGQALTFHVRSMRLQNRIHDLQQHSDPMLTVRTSTGGTLAASDNYFYGDPYIAIQIPSDGEYILELRDSRYQGNRYWEYSIEANSRPFVNHVFPLGVKPGPKVRFELIGDHLPNSPFVEVNVPNEFPSGTFVRAKLGSGFSNPAHVIPTSLPLVTESSKDKGKLMSAQLITAPCGVNGRIGKESELDLFAFHAKKGEKYSFEIRARRHGSMLDSHMRILNDKGRQLSLNDDLRYGKRSHSDSWIENWTAPADGKYFIEVRDLHLRGGKPFIYLLQVEQAVPYFELFADTDKTQLSPGTNGVIFVRTVRKNGFAGEIQLSVDGLPKGVSASCGKILASGQDGCIVLSTNKDSPQSIGNITIRGKAAAGLTATALNYQETYQPGGGRGHWPVIMHTVSVAKPSDIRRVTLSTYDLILKPGESKRVTIKIERSDSYAKNVTLDVLFKHLSSVYGNSLPAGVTIDGANSRTLLTGKQTEGYITLKAAATAAPVSKQQVAVMANVSLNFVMKATYSSPPLFVTVAKK